MSSLIDVWYERSSESLRSDTIGWNPAGLGYVHFTSRPSPNKEIKLWILTIIIWFVTRASRVQSKLQAWHQHTRASSAGIEFYWIKFYFSSLFYGFSSPKGCSSAEACFGSFLMSRLINISPLWLLCKFSIVWRDEVSVFEDESDEWNYWKSCRRINGNRRLSKACKYFY